MISGKISLKKIERGWGPSRKSPTMATLYDVAHFCSWNGYAEDMRSYLGVDKAAWTNCEFWFPYGANVLYGKLKKSRLQILCENSYGENLLIRVKELLAARAKPDISDAEGRTALIVCCHFEQSKIAKLLLDAGANPNHIDLKGRTPVYYSAFHKNIDIMKDLVERGANINVKTIHNSTPIHIASSQGNLDVVKYLMSQGAEIDDITIDGVIDEGRIEILKYFQKSGLQAPIMSIYNAVEYEKPKFINILKKMGASVNGVGDDIPLIYAINEGDYDSMRELCKAGANVNIIDTNMNFAPIHFAIMRADTKAIKILCEYKADLNIRAIYQNPLHYSIVMASAHPDRPAYIDCVKEVINGGPDFSIPNRWGETAAEYAEGCNFHDLVILIKRAEMKARFSSKRR